MKVVRVFECGGTGGVFSGGVYSGCLLGVFIGGVYLGMYWLYIVEVCTGVYIGGVYWECVLGCILGVCTDHATKQKIPGCHKLIYLLLT